MIKNIQSRQTSLSIHSTICKKLLSLSEDSRKSKSEIIVYCLARYSKEVKMKVNLERLSQYQPPCKQYRAVPVKLPQNLYEVCFDLRKSLKLSLSFIFALAFMAYLDDLSRLQEAVPDSFVDAYSYKEFAYHGTHFCKNGRFFFVYSWEKPPD